MAKGFAVLSLMVVGVMLAAVWKNPGGVSAASSGIRSVETPWINGMLGQAS